MTTEGVPASSSFWDKIFLKITTRSWLRIAGLLTLISIIVVAFVVFDADNELEDLLEWIDDNKAPGFFIFVLVYATATVFFIPGSLLSLGAGFVFGIWLGVLAVWTSAVIGQTLAFLAGRYLFREWVSSYAQKFKLWQGLEGACEDDGWKIVALLRLAPIIPYNALNYILGITSVHFLAYFLASAVFIIPGTFLYVYLGSLADSIRELSSDDSPLNSQVTIIVSVISGGASTDLTVCAIPSLGVVILVTVVLTSRYAKRAIDKRVMLENSDENMELPQVVQVQSEELREGESQI